MLIKFNILWFEDDDEYYTDNYKLFEDHLESIGFSLNVTRVSDPESQMESVAENIKNTYQYDMILMDYQFNGSDIGDKLIEDIRTRVVYTDIIFYSGAYDEMLKAIQGKLMSGVYTSHRADLKDEAIGLIGYLLHKALHPEVMRGVVVSSLSEIDGAIYDIYKTKLTDSPNPKYVESELRSKLIKKLDKRYKDNVKALEKEDSVFLKNIETTMLFESFLRCEGIADLFIKDLKSTGLNSIKDSIVELKEVARKRNKLAHWKKSEITDTRITLTEEGKDDYTFCQDEAARIRSDINKGYHALKVYKDKLDELYK